MKLEIGNAERFERERTIVYAWHLGVNDSEGWERGIELRISHNKYGKKITATLNLVGYRDGFVRQTYSFGTGDQATQFLLVTEPVARYSASALARVEQSALARFDEAVEAAGSWLVAA